MRCFIAIDIDEKLKKAIADLQRQLAAKANLKKSDVKWVEPQAMHLTLKFLGEVEDERIVEVCNIVKNAAARNKGFELDIESVGYFGGGSARVLWVGTGRGSENLCRLQEDIEQQLSAAGWPKENRSFAGHLTICRVKNPKAGLKLAQMSEDYKNLNLGTISADSVAVYQSQLRPTGPVYTVLGDYKLQ
jgi:2'-5' RNA ligase